MLRTVLAPNASPLTLDGTRSYLVGRRQVAVIDPGSADPGHLDAIVDLIGDGEAVGVLLTHGHPDHVAGSDELGRRLGTAVYGVGTGTLNEGDRFRTDAGTLTAIATPGHTTDHVAFHWPEEDAVFCGDLMMGGHDTALVAPPEGRLGPYLASLERIRSLAPSTIYPAHGPPFTNPGQALDRYVRHRRLRLDQVRKALSLGVQDYDSLRRAIYGDELEPELERAALAALKAYLEHLQGQGRIRRIGQGWELAE